MEIALNKNELIHLALKEYISEVSIRHLIIKYKRIAEEKETYDYHLEKWNNIVGEYYYCKDSQGGQFSYIWFTATAGTPQSCYWVVPDKKNSFFRITYTSYQSWDMLFDIIKSLKISKDAMIRDDSLFSILSIKLAYAMAAIS